MTLPLHATGPHQRRSPVTADARALLPLIVALVAILSVLPLGRVAWSVLSPAGLVDILPLIARLGGRAVLLATWHTLEVGLAAGAISMLIGVATALCLGVTDMRGKRLFAFLFVMSMLVAPQVAALAFKTLAGPASPLLNAVGLAPAPGHGNPVSGRFGIILVLGLHHAPLVMLTVLAGLKSLPNTLAEAASVDGADGWQLSRLIVLPALRPHLVAAALLAFVAASGNFGIPALLGMPVNYLTLTTLIYRQLSSFGPSVLTDVALLSLLMAALVGFAVFAAERLLRRQTVTLERDRTLQPYWRLGRARPVLEAALWLLVCVTTVLPLLSLLAAALVPSYGMALTPDTLSVRAFTEVLFHQGATAEAFRNSLAFAGIAALLVALLAAPVAYGMERQAGRARGVIAFLIELPYALPGIVLAIACILAFLKPLPLLGWKLYGTGAIIVFAYVARFLALALKPVSAAMRQLDMEIEEAAALCGAGFLARLRLIVLPNLLAAMAAGALFVFLTAFNELTVSALLWSAGTRTLGVVLYGLDDAGLISEASALGVLTTIVVVVLMLLIDKLSARLPAGVVPWRVEG